MEEYIEYLKYLRPDLAEIWNEIHDQTAIFDLEKISEGRYVEKDTSSIEQQVLQGVTSYDPQQANIKIPVLSFAAISIPIRPAYFSEEQKKLADDFHRNQWLPYRQKEIAQFKWDLPQAKIIEIPNGHHACYIAEEDLVYEEMRKFLLE